MPKAFYCATVFEVGAVAVWSRGVVGVVSAARRLFCRPIYAKGMPKVSIARRFYKSAGVVGVAEGCGCVVSAARRLFCRQK